MPEPYAGLVSLDGVDENGADETLYLDLEIDDLDSGSWLGTAADSESVLGITAGGNYRVKLLAVDHQRRRQTADARNEPGSDALCLRGQASFE